MFEFLLAVNTLNPAYASILGTILMISVVFVSLLYLLSFAFNIPVLQAFAKEEFSAFIFTIFLLAFWFSAGSVFSELISVYLTGSPSPSFAGHLDLAIATADSFFDKLFSMYRSLYSFEMLIGFLYTIGFPGFNLLPAIGSINFVFHPFSGLALVSEVHTEIVEYVGYFVTLMLIKKHILIFARDVIPLIFFPLGILFRAFPLLRTTGSTILAFSFTMYFIFPIAVLFSYYLIFDVYQPANFAFVPTDFYLEDSLGLEQITSLFSPDYGSDLEEWYSKPSIAQKIYSQEECAGNLIVRLWCSTKRFFSGIFDFVSAASSVIGKIAQNIFSISSVSELFLTLLTPYGIFSGVFNFLIYEVSLIAPLLVLIIITTIIEFIIIVTMYRNIAELIGGEQQLPGLSKFI